MGSSMRWAASVQSVPSQAIEYEEHPFQPCPKAQVSAAVQEKTIEAEQKSHIGCMRLRSRLRNHERMGSRNAVWQG